MRGSASLGGHFWTIWPHVRDAVTPPSPPAWSAPWTADSVDARFGDAPLTGTLCDLPHADTLVVIVHGLGGSSDSPYMVRTAQAAAQMGLASLRLNLRGADRSGADIYHAGLCADIRGAIQSEAAGRFDTVVVVGFSLGGHIALRLGVEGPGRAGAIAAICSPIDLAATCAHIDSPGVSWIYRRHLLRGLREMYEVGDSARMPPVDSIDSVQTIRDWDERVVAPRFGFAGAQDYWDQCSVAPALGELSVPCLYLCSRRDPMVPPGTVEPALDRTFPNLEVRWVDAGGHVGFPSHLGVERDVLRWLIRSSRTD